MLSIYSPASPLCTWYRYQIIVFYIITRNPKERWQLVYDQLRETTIWFYRIFRFVCWKVWLTGSWKIEQGTRINSWRQYFRFMHRTPPPLFQSIIMNMKNNIMSCIKKQLIFLGRAPRHLIPNVIYMYVHLVWWTETVRHNWWHDYQWIIGLL